MHASTTESDNDSENEGEVIFWTSLIAVGIECRMRCRRNLCLQSPQDAEEERKGNLCVMTKTKR